MTTTHDQVPGQNSVGRAFAGVTLFAGLLLLISAVLPWAYIWHSYYGYVEIRALGTNEDGFPRDGVFALGIGIATICVGFVRVAVRVPLLVRVGQILAGGFLVLATLYDVAEMQYPAAGVYMAMCGGAMMVVGAFPLWSGTRPSAGALPVPERLADNSARGKLRTPDPAKMGPLARSFHQRMAGRDEFF